MKFEASDAGEGSFGLEQTRTAKQRVPDMRRPLQCLKNASKGLFSLTTEKSGLATVGIATELRRPLVGRWHWQSLDRRHTAPYPADHTIATSLYPASDSATHAISILFAGDPPILPEQSNFMQIAWLT